MNSSRFDYLRSKWPMIQYNGWGDALPDTLAGRPIIKSERRVHLKYVEFDRSNVDVNTLIKELRELYKTYPQFKKLEVNSQSGEDIVFKVTGIIDETEGEFKLRLENEKEKMELYELLKKEHEKAVEEEELFQLQLLKQKYEKV